MSLREDLKILSVDDFPTMRRIIKNMLGQLGLWDVHEAEDGAMALSKMRAEKFDLVITDWNMPRMNGLELLKAIKADASLGGIPVVMVTAEADKEQVITALKEGASNYIVKPFNAETLRDKLLAVFKN